jgi:hypothetical protein
MFQVTTDLEKNRLYVTLGGHLSQGERMEAANAFIIALRTLQPAFDILTDMSTLHPTDGEGLKELGRLQAAAKLRGVRHVVRVVKIPLSRQQLGRAADESDWAFETVSTLEEAEALLDALKAEEAGLA